MRRQHFAAVIASVCVFGVLPAASANASGTPAIQPAANCKYVSSAVNGAVLLWTDDPGMLAAGAGYSTKKVVRILKDLREDMTDAKSRRLMSELISSFQFGEVEPSLVSALQSRLRRGYC